MYVIIHFVTRPSQPKKDSRRVNIQNDAVDQIPISAQPHHFNQIYATMNDLELERAERILKT
jgi:hypothetical protein